MTFIDLFSGLGGFRLGLEQAGHICLGHCEYDKYANYSYKAMHQLTVSELETLQAMPVPLNKKGNPILTKQQKYIEKLDKGGEWFENDIRTIRAADIPHADCWCFGFPCQDISVAGKQSGFSGERSSLFFAVTSLIKQLQEKDKPSYLFIENVKNLLSVNKGRDFTAMLVELDEIGYDAEWAVVNSADVIAQNRERIFVIGHIRGRCTAKVFPIEGTGSEANQADVKQLGNFMPTKTRNNPNQGRVYGVDGIAPCLSKMDGGGRQPYIAIKTINPKLSNGKETLQQDRIYAVDGVFPALSSQLNGRFNVAIPVLTPDRAEKRQNGRRFKENGEPIFTLTGQDKHGVMLCKLDKPYVDGKFTALNDATIKDIGATTASTVTSRYHKGIGGNNDNMIIYQLGRGKNKGGLKYISPTLTKNAFEQNNFVVFDGIAIRRLTPRECFRLQTFPDEMFDKAALVNSDSQLYKQAGNSVTVEVIRRIAERMRIE